MVESPPRGIVALEGVAVGEAGHIVDGHPAAALAAQPVLSVLHCHHLLRETALDKVKIETVHRNELR